MPREREAKPMAGFFKFTAVGQLCAGYANRFRTTENGIIVTFEPAIIRTAREAKPQIYGACAVGLSTDLLLKVNTEKDAGKFLLFDFKDTEATKKGSRKKIFRVLELDAQEFETLCRRSDPAHRGMPYYEEPSAAGDESDSLWSDPVGTETDEELPY